MIKFVSRMIIATIAGIGCCCIVEPEAPRGVLRYFADSLSSDISQADPLDPRLSATIATAARALEQGESPETLRDQTKPKVTESARQRVQSMFFSDEASEPATGVLSKLKLPSFSGDAEPIYQPIDIGPAVQANPFLQ